MDETIYYQPFFLDGSYIDELAPFMVFRTEDDCRFWLEDGGYDLKDIAIYERKEGEIKDMVVIKKNGEYEDGTCSVGAYNTEKDLDEGLDDLLLNIKSAKKVIGKDYIELYRPVTLYEDYATLSFDDVPSEFSDVCPEIVAVTSDFAVDSDSNEIPLVDITDFDDFMMLADAVSETAHFHRK